MNNYLPLAVIEALAAQRRPDPRYLAAAGYPLPLPKAQRRRQVGDLLIRLGQKLLGNGQGNVPDPATLPA